jgi:hypothetical protein
VLGRGLDDYDGLALASVVGAIHLPRTEPRTSKPCSRCRRDLPLDAFNRESRARDGQRAGCRECQHRTARAIYLSKTI